MTEYERNVLNNIKFSELETMLLSSRFTNFECYSVLQNFMANRIIFLIVLSYFLIFIDSVCLYESLKEIVNIPNIHSLFVFIIGIVAFNVINLFCYMPDIDNCSCLEVYHYHIANALCISIFTIAVGIIYYYL